MSAGDVDLSHLNQVHQKQVADFLKFFRNKVNENVIDIEHTFEDTKEMRLLDEMYQRDEVESFLDDLRQDVQTNVRGELEKWTHQSVLYIHQLFLQAEGQSCQLKVDTNQLEDQALLEGLKKLDLQESKGLSMSNLPSTSSGKLTSLGDSVDTKLVTKIKDLQEANQRIQARYDQISVQARAALKENSELKVKNGELEEELKTLRNDLENLKATNNTAQQEELETLRSTMNTSEGEAKNKIAELTQELKKAEENLTARVSATPQYKQLNQMLKKKNQQLKEWRAKCKTLEEAAGSG